MADNIQNKKYRRQKKHMGKVIIPSRQPIPEPEPMTVGSVKCVDCATGIPDIVPRRGSTYRCKPCDKMSTFRTFISDMINSYSDKELAEIMKKIDAMFDDTEVYPQYMVRITYNEYKRTHCGYCSDRYDVKTTEKPAAMTLDLPLFRIFKNADINWSNEITDSKKINTFYGGTINNVNFCCHDGFKRYTIDSVRVVKKTDKIILDD